MTQVGWKRGENRWDTGWTAVSKAIFVLLTTRYFERQLREYVGTPLVGLLGELGNPANVMKFRSAVALTILLFEPRFVPTRISLDSLDRTGASRWTIRGIYRPRAHLGDLTPAGETTLVFGADGTGQIVTG